MSILIVDDETHIRTALVDILADLHYDVVGAANGLEALGSLRADPARFQLVVLDVMMPFMSGWVVLDAIRSDSKLAHVKVIMTTTGQDVQQIAFERGAAGYLSKPIAIDKLLNVVAETVGERRREI